jgi:hypothetical protein
MQFLTAVAMLRNGPASVPSFVTQQPSRTVITSPCRLKLERLPPTGDIASVTSRGRLDACGSWCVVYDERRQRIVVHIARLEGRMPRSKLD